MMPETCAGTIPPANVIVLDPPVAVRLPPQSVWAFGSELDAGAMMRFAGRESFKFKLVSMEVFVLVNVMVRVDKPFVLTMGG